MEFARFGALALAEHADQKGRMIVYKPSDRVRMVIHLLHDTLADDQAAARFLQWLKGEHPQAYSDVEAWCAERYDANVAAETAAIPPASASLPPGDLAALATGATDT